MSYAIYTTEGIILGSHHSGEASKLYYLYTKDFGLIFAKAQGVRLLDSKLRFNLEEYSLATFSLVRGKEIWRITGVTEKIKDEQHVLVYARVCTLVRRLVQGEEKNELLFDVLRYMFYIRDSFSKEQAVAFESMMLMYALRVLGYLDSDRIVVLPPAPDISVLPLIMEKKREVIAEINKALKETQL